MNSPTDSGKPQMSRRKWCPPQIQGDHTKSHSFFRCHITRMLWLLGLVPLVLISPAAAQALEKPDRGERGDEMIHEYLRQEAVKIESSTNWIQSPEDWLAALPRFRREYFDMLGLWPFPEKTPLQATMTRRLDRGDYLVNMIHYQSRPGLYVTGNLYRPRTISPGERLPAIFYVCGHAGRGRNGNKTAYQSHGIWLAKHGYICLMVDTLQLGEIAGIHHGTYREGRWWWLSRGYTPAGVECWNGIRGLDYLAGRPEVDPQRMGVTGISGGGAATFWITAADERVKVAVPVSGLSDLVSYVSDRVVNDHCDCMFLYNTYQWPWARIPALIAPRPLLFVNSDQDSLFPMDGNERVINRLERVYSLFGAGDSVDSVVSIGGHAYRKDIRQAEYRFLNTWLKNDPRPVMDSEVDLVTGASEPVHPIAPEQLRVFPQDSDFPADALNAKIDSVFVPIAKPELPKAGEFDSWRKERLAKLRQMTFHHFPERVPPARAVETDAAGAVRLETEAPIRILLRETRAPGANAQRTWVIAAGEQNFDWAWLNKIAAEQDGIYTCEPRGIGDTSWSHKNPPNYVERAHYLLGRTVDSGRVWDLAATARYVRTLGRGRQIYLAGEGPAAVLAVYAALLEPDVAGVALLRPLASHMDDSAPALLNVLRVCDIPEAVGMLAPRPVKVVEPPRAWRDEPARIYQSAGASEMFSEQRSP
jgi:dienelactone hydrolase